MRHTYQFPRTLAIITVFLVVLLSACSTTTNTTANNPPGQQPGLTTAPAHGSGPVIKSHNTPSPTSYFSSYFSSRNELLSALQLQFCRRYQRWTALYRSWFSGQYCRLCQPDI